MSALNPNSKEYPEEFQVPQLRFLGQQDGPPERELKCRLVQFFLSEETVNTAYLARVAYTAESVSVALCLRARFGPDRGLAQEVGRIFASMFGSHEHLDIIFLSDMQEAELAIVCKPFFQAGDKEGGRGQI